MTIMSRVKFSFILVLAFLSGYLCERKGSSQESRYLLYDVNPGEGFNLRRDVYIRMSNLIRKLNYQEKWTLVLPPWGRIYHWFSATDEAKIPWSDYFDLESLRKFIPVIEFSDFLKVFPKPVIDEVYLLQWFPRQKKMVDGEPIEWQDRYEKQECQDNYHGYYQDHGVWRGWFFGNGEKLVAKSFSCLSVQYEASRMTTFFNETKARVVMLDHAEILIHGMLSEWSPEYWTGRRSMVFAERLHRACLQFLWKRWPAVLHSSVDPSLLSWQRDWRRRRPEILSLEDTPAYVAIHMRRMDFLSAHADRVPSLRTSAEQALIALRKFKLKHLLVATDAPAEEVKTFKEYFPPDIHVMRFENSNGKSMMPGELAIIDQILCSFARHFIGTSSSTFSSRIHEEREILGFPPDSTYNRLCVDTAALGSEKCANPTIWRIQYEPDFTLPPEQAGHTEL